MKLLRSLAAPVLIVVLLSQTACNPNLIKSFRVALASSGPLINSLVNTRAIDATVASNVRTDFDDGAKCADTLQSDFSLIPKGDPNSKGRKLNASARALKCFRVIIDRQNFAKHPRLQTASNIAEGILATLVVFYSEAGPMRASAEGSRRAVRASDEKDMEQKLKSQVEELKQAMKP